MIANPVLRLDPEALDRAVVAHHGRMSQAELAARLGVHPTVLSQFRTGRRAPGGRFVAAVAALVPDVDLRTVFKIKEREIST